MFVNLLLQARHFLDDKLGSVERGHDANEGGLDVPKVFNETHVWMGFIGSDCFGEFGEGSEVAGRFKECEAAESFDGELVRVSQV